MCKSIHLFKPQFYYIKEGCKSHGRVSMIKKGFLYYQENSILYYQENSTKFMGSHKINRGYSNFLLNMAFISSSEVENIYIS